MNFLDYQNYKTMQKYKIIQLSIFLLALPLVQAKQFQAITSYGIILNHNDQNDILAIQSYIDRLNNPRCKGVSEINIISPQNYQQHLKKMNNQFASSTSIPLNFAFIKEDEKASEFIIPEGSKSEFFYIGSILSKETCEQINQKIERATSYMIGGLIPLIGQQNQQSVITVENAVKEESQIFNYNKNEAYKLFQIVEKIRIISRHTIELSKSAINEVALMSKEASPACEEILINFVASHFYPELKNRYLSFQNKLPADYSQKSMSEKKICVKKFISILGYCPLFYQNKFFNATLWRNPQEEKVVELKKVDLMGKLAQLQDSQRRLLQTSLDKQIDQQRILILRYLAGNKSLLCFTLLVFILIAIFVIFFLRFRLKALKKHLYYMQKKGQSN